MQVNNALGIVAHFVDSTVNGEASGVYAVRCIVKDVTLSIDLNQVRGGNLVKRQAKGVNQVMISARYLS